MKRLRQRLKNAPSAPTSKGTILLALAGALFLIGTNTGSTWLYLEASACLVAVILSGAYSALPLRRLRASRGGLVRATIGELAEYPVTLKSPGLKVPIVIYDPATASYPAAVETPRGAGEFEGMFRALPTRRGVHRSSPLVAVCEAPLGLWRTRREIPATGDVEISPPVAEVGLPKGLTTYVLHGEGRREPPKRGRGYDFFALREYQSGDPVRYIYWPATARRDEVIVREFEEEGVTPLAIFVVTAGEAPESAFDRVLSVAGTMVKAAVMAHIPVRLAIPGGGAKGAPMVLDSPSSNLLKPALAAAPAPVEAEKVAAAARICRSLPIAAVVGIKPAGVPWPHGTERITDFAVIVGDPEAQPAAADFAGVRTWLVPSTGEICFLDSWQASAA